MSLRLAILLVALASPALAQQTRPHLLLISIDTLRADHVGAYGYGRETTPALDRLAREGTLFERASATSPWTLPSHASLVTGMYTAGHGLTDDHHNLSRDVPVLTEILARAGYRVGALVNTNYLLPSRGLLRVCETFRYLRPITEDGARVLAIDEQVRTAIAFIDTEDPRPFFLFLHTYDVHSDYLPGARYRERFIGPYDGIADGTTRQLLDVRRGQVSLGPPDLSHVVDLYDAALRQLDDGLRPLFAHLESSGLASSTLVIVTSDHGEEFGDHGGVLHGRTLYDEMLRVPLIVRGPGVPAGRRVAAPVSIVDVAPTLLAAAGEAFPGPVDGRDLARAWSTREESRIAPVFAQVDRRRLARGGDDLTSVQLDGWKLIWDRRLRSVRLFDLEKDPHERRDLSAERPEQVQKLLRHAERHAASTGSDAVPQELRAEDVELLRQLGYVE